MTIRKFLFGAMGFLSLLGFIGIFTEQKSFLIFFAFAIDFEYWFMKSDEMFENYMIKSASNAFYCGMLVTAGTSLFHFFINNQASNNALSLGLAYGWAVSVFIYAISTAYFGFKEKWSLNDD